MSELSPIEAHERRIERIFSDDYAFEVPAYQRPYAWEQEQARDLLNDICEAMDNSQVSGGVYFLGSIVLIKAPGSPRAQVVDGQQRLTTLTLLLSALRDLTTDLVRKSARSGYVHQAANPDTGAADRYRLLLRDRDREFFSNHVQKLSATDETPVLDKLTGSQLRLMENVALFRSRLEAMDEARRDDLVAFIIQRCYLVVVAVPTADAARRIFTVLNARGLDLTATDILKAQLLERAGGLREDALAKRWEAVEQALGRDPFVELFGHIRMMFEREKARLALENAFPDKVEAFRGSPDAFIADVLEPVADVFTLFSEGTALRAEFGNDAARAVRSLNRIDNKDWLPPALLKLWRRKLDDKLAVAQFLVNLERLAYFLFVTRADVNERIVRFAAVMDEVEPRLGRPNASIGIDLTNEEKRSFHDALDGALYRKSRVCRPVLQRLDETLSTGGAEYDEAVVSIEHVLPQTVDAGSEWAQHFPDESIRAAWTHRLANLVLLTRRINTRASNWPFERKKLEYFKGRDGAVPFKITQEVQNTANWTLEILEERQTELVRRLADLWRL